MNLRDIGGAMPFAHLLGLTQPKAAAGEDGAPSGPPRTAPGAHLAGAPAEDDKAEDDKDAEGEKAPEAETPPQDAPAPKAKPEDAAEDEDAEAQGDGAAAQARARERARCAAILGSPHATACLPFAAYLATQTTLPRAAALSALEYAASTLPAAAASGSKPRQALDQRMAALTEAENPSPAPGGGAPPAEGAEALAAQMIANANAARGIKA